LTLDPRAAEAAITPRTAALLPVHLYGQPADMSAFEALGRRHGLALIEDACQAHAATSAGRPVGTMGVAGAFSFYPTKNLGALGDAGAVITNDAGLADGAGVGSWREGKKRHARSNGAIGRAHVITGASDGSLTYCARWSW
jgi:dTDP-4-amino-4,6-dideoxygalactose transaminase